MKGDIELAHRPERPGQLSNLAACVGSLAALESSGEDGDGLAKTAGCDPGLVHTVVVPRNCGRKITFERACALLK